MKTAYMNDLAVSESYKGRETASEAENRIKQMGAKRLDLNNIP